MASSSVEMHPEWLCFTYANTPVAAVALSRNGANRWHAGILHTESDGTPRLLHLAWHNDLQRDEQAEGYVWVVPGRPKERLDSVAAMCRRVWNRHAVGGIPYGLKYATTSFQNDGTLRLDKNSHGLTCATFVLAVFRSVGIDLLDVTTWKDRDSDAAWQAGIVDMLKKLGAPEDHVDAVRGEIGCARFRPAEVGAASRRPRGSTFEEAVEDAIAIDDAISRHRNATASATPGAP